MKKHKYFFNIIIINSKECNIVLLNIRNGIEKSFKMKLVKDVANCEYYSLYGNLNLICKSVIKTSSHKDGLLEMGSTNIKA